MRKRRVYTDYLRDMADYAEKAMGFVKGLNFKDFQKDERTIFAVTRALEVIGEAARHIPKVARRRYPEIPWEKAVAMRNVVIHEYFGVNLKVIWRTVHEDLPSLHRDISRIVREVKEAEDNASK